MFKSRRKSPKLIQAFRFEQLEDRCQPANSPFAYVQELYQSILHRAPDPAGLTNWVGMLQSGASPATVAQGLWASEEHRGLQVDDLFASILHRNADPTGRQAWVNFLVGGADVNALAVALLASAEYQASHPDNDSFVEGLYQDVLGRASDPAGKTGWLTALQAGATRADVALGFVNSPEGLTHLVQQYYGEFFDRGGDADGLTGWVGGLSAGQLTPTSVAVGFLASDEFSRVADAPISASLVYVLTDANRLLSVRSDEAFNILSDRAITGLQSGENLLAIDVRPATGELYGLSDGNRLYVINPNTGSATVKTTLTADPNDASTPFTTLVGTDFGIDFNPVVDRLRIVSNANENLRVHPDTGLVTTDRNLAFGVGDPHEGEDPTITEAAYTNNLPGATSTTLFVADRNIRLIGKQDPPNDGVIRKVIPFGKLTPTGNFADIIGFDIAPSGQIITAVETHSSSGVLNILVIPDLVSGSDLSLGEVGDGHTSIRDIAIGASLQFSKATYGVSEQAKFAAIEVTRSEFGTGTFTIDFTTVAGTAIAGQDFVATSGTLTFAPDEVAKTIYIPIIDDGATEGDETFSIVLSNPGGVTTLGGPSTATVRIGANDAGDQTGPTVVSIGLRGPSRGIRGAVIRFSEDLDPVFARNPDNYALIGIAADGTQTRITFNAAQYDPGDRSVTLTIPGAFPQTQFVEQHVIVKSGPAGIRDIFGNFLDGDRNGVPGGDSISRFAVFSGTSVTILDDDGDEVTIAAENIGQVDGIRPLNGPSTQKTQFWYLNTVSLVSRATGTVTQSPTGDGIVVIAEIIGLDKKESAPLTTNPAIRINRLTFSPDATGK